MSRRHSILLTAILLAGAALRLHFDNVPANQFTRADEGTYLNNTRHLVNFGWSDFPALNRAFRSNPENWLYPSPLRWGYLVLTTTTCQMTGSCGYETLAGLATFSGIAALLLTFLIGRETLGVSAGLLATAFMATSPLELALGRRALQDEVYCAVVLLAIWLLLRAIREDATGGRLWRRRFGVIAVMTLTFSIKESFVLLYPALFGLIAIRASRRRLEAADLLLFGLPAALNYVGFSLLSRSFADYFRDAKMTTSTVGAAYAVTYQSGPPQRLLIDLVAISPIVILLAVAGVAMVALRPSRSAPGVVRITLALLLIIFVYGLFPSKNVRYIVAADPLLRLLAGWAVVNHPLVQNKFVRWAPFAILNGWAELSIFNTVFVANAVYDPVTFNILRALRIIPGL